MAKQLSFERLLLIPFKTDNLRLPYMRYAELSVSQLNIRLALLTSWGN